MYRAWTVVFLLFLSGLLAGSALAPGVSQAATGKIQTGVSQAATGDIGYEGRDYTGASTPTGSKPESKLWWNDGFWWASMFDTTTLDYHIFKLDTASQTWVDTGVALDPRYNSRADTLWDGTHLYVASHVFSESPASGYPSYLYRFSYDPALDTYSLDAGFPVSINNYRTETLVLEKDSTGMLWATWVQGNQVYVNRTVGSDATWGTPFVLPVSGTSVSSDDISSVVAFDGNKIGVMWSNQVTSTMYFSIHVDGQPDTTWGASRSAYSGANNADDHINLKTLQADSSGRVFAAIKTSQTASTAPLIVLVVYNSGTGAFGAYPFGLVRDSHTRPIVMIDTTSQRIYMFATGPQPPNTSGQSGGDIYMKSTSIASPAFPTGYGTPVIRDADSAVMNNSTSTKQTVSSTTGLVVVASNDATKRYWHYYNPLDGSPPPAPVAPANTAPPAISGTAQEGQTLSANSGSWTGTEPISYAYQWQRCDSGGGACANVASGQTYTLGSADVGSTMRVVVTASNSAGSSSATSAPTAVVSGAPPPPGGSTFGKTTIGGSFTSAGANYKFVTRFTLSSSASVSKLTAYLFSKGTTGLQPLRGVIYADSSGAPGALEATSQEVVIPAGTAKSWVDFPFASAVTLPAGTYWLGLHAGAGTTTVYYAWDTVTGIQRIKSDTYTDGASDPFGTTSAYDREMSVYATLGG